MARNRRELITPAKIAIGCYSCLLGEGIKKLLENEKGIKVTGVFNEGLDFEEIIEKKPDIAILDFEVFNDLPKGIASNDKIKILLYFLEILIPGLQRIFKI
jgi:DNA-binding NarL/FixJ family response regulator